MSPSEHARQVIDAIRNALLSSGSYEEIVEDIGRILAASRAERGLWEQLATVGDLTRSAPLLAYGVRRCGDHWHVTHAGEDLGGADVEPRFFSITDALDRADALNGRAERGDEDSQRLDWLHEHYAKFIGGSANGAKGHEGWVYNTIIEWDNLDGSPASNPRYGMRERTDVPTRHSPATLAAFREVIDAARSASRPEEPQA